MKFSKTIRWRLQIWYGLILGVVLAGFCMTVYQLEGSLQRRQIDDQARRGADVSESGSLGWKLGGIAGAVLVLALVGGWTLASRFVRETEAISAAVAKISAGDLSQRIHVRAGESELGELAAALNATFARLEGEFARQENFISDAAHALRTSGSLMLTQMQAALTQERSDAEYRETLETCEQAAQRARHLAESLLEMARLDAGLGFKKNIPFDLSEAVRECVELIRPMAVERGVELLCQAPPVKCVGDPNRVGQVIVNLLTNAIQYNKVYGRVHILTEWQSGTAILTITDTGAGIAAENLPHIFRRFYRGDKASPGHGGLGLAIAKSIVEAHGGKMNVSSQANIGSTFSVYLPSPE